MAATPSNCPQGGARKSIVTCQAERRDDNRRFSTGTERNRQGFERRKSNKDSKEFEKRDGRTFKRVFEPEPEVPLPVTEEEVWRYVDRELIKVGKNGVGNGHRNMLQELCTHHPVGVKVKLNHDSIDLEKAKSDLLEAPGVELKQVKGRTLLFKKTV
eukprot:CAMPEP_0196588040 /NCGR_PEP_ID=MMETSP1081-20130531/59393_1 /TAXON_ID=36882 /ORGANISM="Pyramimonas amylifera, Strain CCMP720" /LENGTH=156 /DNA_ID=CAMNT_0041910419 /DNA_START=150 /DNA_END=620 /DNA_ORIENTATION=+